MRKKVKSAGRRRSGETRERLLRAGVRLFAGAGYDGVAVDEIVAAAGCNKRMLYHYFGSKEGLYREVLREVFARLEGFEATAVPAGAGLEEAVRGILRQYFAFLSANPEFVALLMWENLRGGRFLDAHPGILGKAVVLGVLEEALRRDGGGPDARHLLALLIGASFVYFSNRHTLRHTVGLDTSDRRTLEAGRVLAEEALLRGLLAGRARRSPAGARGG